MIKLSLKNLNNDTIKSLHELSKDLSFTYDNSGINLDIYTDKKQLQLKMENNNLKIYISKKVELFLGISIFLQKYKGNDFVYTNKPRFNDLCYMVDCSRNAVPKVDTIKKLIRMLAVMGYDSLQLYTEDTFEVINEPYFGYLRGKYTKEELKDIDNY